MIMPECIIEDVYNIIHKHSKITRIPKAPDR